MSAVRHSLSGELEKSLSFRAEPVEALMSASTNLLPSAGRTGAGEQPSSVDLIRQEEQRRFERFIYLGAVGIWLTGLLMVGVVVQLEPQLARMAQLWGAAFTVLMLATVITWAMVGQYLASMGARDKWHVVIVAAHGLMWALPPFLFFVPEQPLVTMFMLCMVCGMSAAGVPIFGTRPALYALIFVPPFVAQIGVFGWYGWQTGDTFHGFLGAAMLLLLSVNLIFSRFTWATLNRSIVLAYENQALVEQLQAQAEQLSATTRAAQEANTAKTKFLAAASHDLRQPVHALNLFVEVLSGTQLDDKQTTMVQHIRTASQASREMLNTLLDYSRIEAGVMVAKKQVISLAPMLRELEDEFGPQADGRGLVYRTRDTDLRALCDATMTQLILRNFLSNALRYTNRGGILVCARRRGVEVLVQVMDTGVGIAREHWEEVFKEFRQLGNEERDRQKGLGLGLAIAKGLAQSMGARIELSSRLEHGSVFTLCLPQVDPAGDGARPSMREVRESIAMHSGNWSAATLAPMAQALREEVLDVDAPLPDRADALDDQSVRPELPVLSSVEGLAGASTGLARTEINLHSQQTGHQTPLKHSPEASLQGLRVLVVDDEEAVRISMQALLESWGCEVRVAEGLNEAIALGAAPDFAAQLLITDYRLREGVTGAQVIAAVRKQDAARQGLSQVRELPVIIITGDTAPERIREAASQTATLLHKPVGTHTLREAMLELC